MTVLLDYSCCKLWLPYSTR